MDQSLSFSSVVQTTSISKRDEQGLPVLIEELRGCNVLAIATGKDLGPDKTGKEARDFTKAAQFFFNKQRLPIGSVTTLAYPTKAGAVEALENAAKGNTIFFYAGHTMTKKGHENDDFCILLDDGSTISEAEIYTIFGKGFFFILCTDSCFPERMGTRGEGVNSSGSDAPTEPYVFSDFNADTNLLALYHQALGKIELLQADRDQNAMLRAEIERLKRPTGSGQHIPFAAPPMQIGAVAADAGKLAEAMRANEGLTARLEALREEMARVGQENTGLTALVERPTTEKDGMAAQFGRLTAEKENLTAQVARLTAEKDGMAAQVARLTATQAECDARIQSLSVEKEELIEKNQALAGMNASNHRQIQIEKQNAAEMERRMRRDLDEAHNEMQNLRIQLGEATSRVRDQKDDIDELRAELTQTKELLNESELNVERETDRQIQIYALLQTAKAEVSRGRNALLILSDDVAWISREQLDEIAEMHDEIIQLMQMISREPKRWTTTRALPVSRFAFRRLSETSNGYDVSPFNLDAIAAPVRHGARVSRASLEETVDALTGPVRPGARESIASLEDAVDALTGPVRPGALLEDAVEQSETSSVGSMRTDASGGSYFPEDFLQESDGSSLDL